MEDSHSSDGSSLRVIIARVALLGGKGETASVCDGSKRRS